MFVLHLANSLKAYKNNTFPSKQNPGLTVRPSQCALNTQATQHVVGATISLPWRGVKWEEKTVQKQIVALASSQGTSLTIFMGLFICKSGFCPQCKLSKFSWQLPSNKYFSAPLQTFQRPSASLSLLKCRILHS